MEQAKAVLQQFLLRFNRPFQVPAQNSEPAFQSLQPNLRLEQVLYFKHRRRVAGDNTVKFQKRTLQLMPGLELPSYAGAHVMILEGLDGRLSVQHDGRIIAAQEAPLSPGNLRRTRGALPSVPTPTPNPDLPSTASASALEMLNSQVCPEDDHNVSGDEAPMGELQAVHSPGKPTFSQRERWKAVQQAKLKGLSIRGMLRWTRKIGQVAK